MDRALRLLGARRLLPRCEGDDIDNALSEQFDRWMPSLWRAVERADAAALGGAAQQRSGAQARRHQQKLLQGLADAERAEAAASSRAAEARPIDEAGLARLGSEGGECCGGEGGEGGEGCGGEGGECCGGEGGEGGECCRTHSRDSAHVTGETPAPAPTTAPVVSPSEGMPVEESDDEASEHGSDGGYGSDGGQIVDVEDLGTKLVARKGAGAAEGGDAGTAAVELKPMVTDSLKASLTKQGYRIVGTHSGVKLCRWTKAMLRGRGGCYKHTFYGIVSYQCMEATPSLACANKCVFCWRHHDNPVGTSFRWQVDSPQLLLDGFEQNHLQMLRQMKGVPGVLPERFAEASRSIRHCALSLVGEPIIYPRINEFLDLLHAKGVSSFMVTNAQFPEQMETLRPCTQLYISVDAPTETELKAVDRPLFPDFWQRFLRCVEMLKEKRQRTVFRLTLVNGWNTEQLHKYVELVRLGRPDFVEVKGVTYCGDSKASPLTIKHCPFHHQVRPAPSRPRSQRAARQAAASGARLTPARCSHPITRTRSLAPDHSHPITHTRSLTPDHSHPITHARHPITHARHPITHARHTITHTSGGPPPLRTCRCAPTARRWLPSSAPSMSWRASTRTPTSCSSRTPTSGSMGAGRRGSTTTGSRSSIATTWPTAPHSRAATTARRRRRGRSGTRRRWMAASIPQRHASFARGGRPPSQAAAADTRGVARPTEGWLAG